MTIRERLNKAAAERILILDGAMGSMIQACRLPDGKPLDEEAFRGERFAGHNKQLRNCNEVLCLSRPEIISGIHEAYLEAGADIIETCSLNTTTISLKDYGLEAFAREISIASAALARKAADKYSTPEKPRFVAGSIGPTAKSVTFTPDMDQPWERQISWDELEAAYFENAGGLVEGGVDFLLLETFFDSLNAKAALFAINRLSNKLGRDIPVMVSATVGEAGRLHTGQTPEAFCASMFHAEPWALGLNCSFGIDGLKTPFKKLSAFAPCLAGFYPNAGLPDRNGNYNDTPEIMAASAETCMKEGLVNIIGGCCGSTPAHITAIAKKAANYKPRSIPAQRSKITLAGTKVMEFEIRENSTELRGMKEGAITGCLTAIRNKCEVPWQSALDKGDYEDAIEIARDQAEAAAEIPVGGLGEKSAGDGKTILLVNTDKAPNPLSTAENFIRLAAVYSELAELPIFIESASWDVIVGGLKCFQGRGAARYTGQLKEPSELQAMAGTLRFYGAVLVNIE